VAVSEDGMLTAAELKIYKLLKLTILGLKSELIAYVYGGHLQSRREIVSGP
jgi:hypothetical protein